MIFELIGMTQELFYFNFFRPQEQILYSKKLNKKSKNYLQPS